MDKTIEVSKRSYQKLKESVVDFDDFLKTDMEGMEKDEIREKRDDLLWDITFSARNLVTTAKEIRQVKDRMEISGRYFERLKETAGAFDDYINSTEESDLVDAADGERTNDYLWKLSFSSREVLRSTRNMYLSCIRKEMKTDLDARRITDQEYRCLFRNLDSIRDQMDHMDRKQYRAAADTILKTAGLQITDSIGSELTIPSLNGSTLMQ